MTDDELIRDFIKVETTDEGIIVQVMEISWDGPHTPVSKWTKARELPGNAMEAKINAAKAKLLKNKRFFQVCPECNERNPVGWMMDEYCQSCGERNQGVVF